MRDFEPIVYDFPDNKDIVIYPISDVHIGAQECMVKVWTDFKKKLLSEPNSYITIAGDMMNNGLKNSVTNVYQETMRPREQKKWLVEQLMDIKDKILCVVPGNHENRNDKEVDNNPLYDVCCKLDIEDKFREIANKRYKNRHGALNNTLIDLITALVEGKITLPEKKE